MHSALWSPPKLTQWASLVGTAGPVQCQLKEGAGLGPLSSHSSCSCSKAQDPSQVPGLNSGSEDRPSPSSCSQQLCDSGQTT